jgi:hypothetical protein
VADLDYECRRGKKKLHESWGGQLEVFFCFVWSKLVNIKYYRANFIYVGGGGVHGPFGLHNGPPVDVDLQQPDWSEHHGYLYSSHLDHATSEY